MDGDLRRPIGKGTVDREYRRELRSRVIHLTNRVVYPPQPANPKGEVHEAIGIFNFDRSAKRIRLRQFHVEGFVVHYVEGLSSTAGWVVFESEAIENIPAGYRSRESYKMVGPDELEETFELAEPGKDFAVYSKSRVKRVK